MCKVSPDHIEFLRVFGGIFFVGGIASALSGTTYYRRLIRRDEEPIMFWVSTASLLVIGGGVLVGILVCP